MCFETSAPSDVNIAQKMQPVPFLCIVSVSISNRRLKIVHFLSHVLLFLSIVISILHRLFVYSSFFSLLLLLCFKHVIECVAHNCNRTTIFRTNDAFNEWIENRKHWMPIQNESSNKNYHMKNIDEKLSNQFKCNKSQISTRNSKIATKCIRLIGITCVSIPNEYRTNNVNTCSKTVRPMVRRNIHYSMLSLFTWGTEAFEMVVVTHKRSSTHDNDGNQTVIWYLPRFKCGNMLSTIQNMHHILTGAPLSNMPIEIQLNHVKWLSYKFSQCISNRILYLFAVSANLFHRLQSFSRL